MQAWLGLFRRSEQAPEPDWRFDTELFSSLDHARVTFEARTEGRRPKPPPLVVRFDYFGAPHPWPETQHWITPHVDKTATLRLLPLAGFDLNTMAAGVQLGHDLTVRLNQFGRTIILKTRGHP